ncbi:MAG: GNAT family N-acetyltransferase [Bacteroidetes bacterium]|nr:GNAT family N-acetyltransferase [Bacteroidota bacterium]
MTIRPLALSDIEGCAALYLQAYNRAPWNYNFTLEKAARYLAEYAERKRFVGFVLSEGDLIVGAMLGHSKTWWTNDLLYIDELFISPDRQRMGYGKMLIDRSEEYAKGNGLEVITLMTNRHMPALKFYENNDFIQADHFTILFKPV